ncbi:MAG: YlbF family regulator [Clostridia bacterium]|nr:YlbF family regulator [Clostridia bacterium]
MEYSQAHILARAIRDSEEYQTYHSLRDEIKGDATTDALIKEYKKLQISLQMATMSGQKPDDTDMQRFQGISSLLFTKPEVSQYLLAEMRLQQALADIFKILTDAADIDIQMPDPS